MTAVRKLIFALLLAGVAVATTGCERAERTQADPSGLQAVDQTRIDRLVLRLGTETVVPGPTGGRTTLFAGEFDRHSCPAIDELVAVGRPAMEPLGEATGNANPVVRRNAAFALAAFSSQSTLREAEQVLTIVCEALGGISALALLDGLLFVNWHYRRRKSQ